MADPVRGGSIIDRRERDHLHSKDISSTLEFLRITFEREGIPFGLIGALALTYYGYERFTEDIDILTTPEGLERIHEAVVGRGLLPRAPGLRKKLRQLSESFAGNLPEPLRAKFLELLADSRLEREIEE